MKKTVSILGCGWLGLPLGASLLEKKYTVNGSTTREEKLSTLAKAGINPFLLRMEPDLKGDDWEKFLTTDYLIVDVPPKTRQQGEDFHPKQMQYLSERLKNTPVQKIIYISSTSVYPENKQAAREEDVTHPEQAINKALVKAENALQEIEGKEVTILRCGGLLGYDRIPGKYFIGKRNIPYGGKPVNFVHRGDVIHTIKVILEKEIWGEVFNLVAPEHPPRQEVYWKNAELFGFEKTDFSDHDTGDYKIVDSTKLMKQLNYEFIFPDPMNFYYNK